jgi:DNA polymerase III, delta subunit
MNKTDKNKNSNLNCDFAHHAYCLLGDRQIVLDVLHSELEEKLNFVCVGNPDYWFAEYDKLNMKDGTKEVVREEILSQALLRPINGENRVMVISANYVNDNVQNALLKFFEEPIPGLKVFLILPNDNHLLPTVKSRLITLEVEGESEQEEKLLDEVKFLKGQIYTRMEIASAITKALSDEEINRGGVVAFFRRLEKKAFEEYKKKNKSARPDEHPFGRGLLRVAHNDGGEENKKQGGNEWLLELEKCCGYAEDPSSSFKVLLEYLAMILPKM